MSGSKSFQIIYTPGPPSNRPDRVAIEMKAQHLGRETICTATDRVRPGFVDYKLIRAKEKISPAFMFRNRLGKTYEAVPQVCVPSQSRYFLLEFPRGGDDNIAHLYPVNEYYTTTLNLTRDPDSIPIKEDEDDAEVKDDDDDEDSGSDVDVEPEDDDEDSGKSKALDPLKEIELQNTTRFNKEKKKKLKEAEVPVDKPKEKIVMITPTSLLSSPTSSSSSSSSMVTGVKREREGGESDGQPEKKRRKNQISQKSIVNYFAKNGPRIATSRLEKHRRKKCLTPEMQEEFDKILRVIAEIVEVENKKYYTLKQSKLGPQ